MTEPGSSPRDVVAGPAKWLKLYAIISAVLAVIGIGFNILGGGMGAAAAGSDEEAMLQIFSGGLGVVFSIISIVIAWFTMKAADRMANLEGHTPAIVFSLLALIPCTSGCCLIGLPIGIWCLVVLMKQEVKEAFTS
jgi:hypothetical protein